MSHVTIFDNEYMSVAYLPDKKIIFHTIHKPVSGKIFRDALMAGTEALERYGAEKWLSDDRKNGPLSPEDIEWGRNHWSHITINAGWKYWAVVVPEQIVAAGSLAPMMNAFFERGVQMIAFDNVEDAMQWLNSQG